MLRPWEFHIDINTNCDRAIYVQIADALIDAIKSGKLKSGEALPGSRQLGLQLKINRNTVAKALDILLAEGWLVSKERKGTFVSENLPEFKIQKATKEKEDTINSVAIHPNIVFDDGIPDARIAPINELARAYRQIFSRKARWQMMGYSNELGDIEFRNAIVHMLNHKRGMRINSDEICITRGSQMAMYLSAQCLFEKGDFVLIENPGYKPAWLAFENAGATLLPVNVESDGLSINQVKAYLKEHKNIKAIYTTPHHQFPTTVTLSLQKRLELIALSNEYGFTIIEDDYDNEFHFSQRPILPISSYENAQNYIYIGTLSKIIAPALRIGFLASGKDFIAKVASLRKIIDVQGDNIMEQAMLQLINDGEVKRHLKRATSLYKTKRDYFESLLLKHLDGKADFTIPEGGLAFWIVPKKEIDLAKLSEILLKQGIQIMPPEKFSHEKPINGLRLGYASLTEKQLEEGIIAIANHLN